MKGEFKTNKNTRILMLYNSLISGQFINKATYSAEHNINERTFERDIAEIRNYLSEIFSIHELLYDRINDAYYLTGTGPKFIEKMDATILAKILIESKVFRKDELEGLLEKIMVSVKSYELDEIISYLNNDLNYYNSKTATSIMKILTDLYMIIEKGNDIEVTYYGGESFEISPIKIIVEDSSFKLLGTVGNELIRYIKVNIEKISNFQNLKTFNAKVRQQDYYNEREEQENGN